MLQFPLAYILSLRTTLGAHGLWWSFPISNVAAAIIAGIWFSRGDWKKRRLIPQTREEEDELEVAREVQI